MRSPFLVSLLLSIASVGCKTESVADKYIKNTANQGQSNTDPKETPKPTTPTTPEVSTGDAAAGETILTGTCGDCHGNGVAATVLDKSAIAKLDAAKEQALHKSFLQHFDGDDRKNIEAALEKK